MLTEAVESAQYSSVLLDKENIDCKLQIQKKGSGFSQSPALLLTDSRVIYLSNKGGEVQTKFAQIIDIEFVNVGFESSGSTAFLWALFSVVVSVMLFLMIDSILFSWLAAIIVISLGVVLLFDRISNPGEKYLEFHSKNQKFRCFFSHRLMNFEAYQFINRFYMIKKGEQPFSRMRNLTQYLPKI